MSSADRTDGGTAFPQQEKSRWGMTDVSEWQSIDTAPRDRRILLFRSNESVGIGSYCDDRYSKRPRPYWSDERSYMSVAWMRHRPPTHWMSLPDPPLAARKEGSS